MACVRDILANKGTDVLRIDASATVLEATQAMNQQQVGALVVTEGERIVGIFTERDVLRRVVAKMQSSESVRVADVMTREVICVNPETDLDEVAAIMKNQRIRHLPVWHEGGRLVGLVSIGDVNAHYASNQAQTIHFLEDYLFGRV